MTLTTFTLAYTDTPKIALIISSTRPTRWADKPARWMLGQMQARLDLTAEILDLRDFDLPFYHEAAPLAAAPAQDPKLLAWQARLAAFDGFVFVLAEYNRAMTGALKNALDSAYGEWSRKPFGSIGYGSAGAAYATANLRLSAVELQMTAVRSAVYIAGSDFYRVGPWNPAAEPIEAIEQGLKGSAASMLDEIVWYARALKTARDAA